MEDYTDRCRAVIIGLAGELPAEDLSWAMHLVDHGEAPEGHVLLGLVVERGGALRRRAACPNPSRPYGRDGPGRGTTGIVSVQDLTSGKWLLSARCRHDDRARKSSVDQGGLGRPSFSRTPPGASLPVMRRQREGILIDRPLLGEAAQGRDKQGHESE